MTPTDIGKILHQYMAADLQRQAARGKSIDFFWYGKFCLQAALAEDDLPLLTQRAIDALYDELLNLCKDQEIHLQQALQGTEVDTLIWETAEIHTPHHRLTVNTLHYLYSQEMGDIYNEGDDYFISGENQLEECIHYYLKQELEAFCLRLQQDLDPASPS